MLPPYCCWLVGVCAVPGKGGPPNVPGGVAGGRAGLRRRRAQRRRRGGKPHTINHNVRKLRVAQDLAEFFLAPGVTGFSHDDDRAALLRWGDRAAARPLSQARHTSCAPLLPGFKVAIVFSILSLSVLKGSKWLTLSS